MNPCGAETTLRDRLAALGRTSLPVQAGLVSALRLEGGHATGGAGAKMSGAVVAGLAVVILLAACTGDSATPSPQRDTLASAGAPPKTFQDVYDMRSALEAASGDASELDCEDSFGYRINGEGGTSVVCSLPDRPDGAHEVIRLVTCV